MLYMFRTPFASIIRSTINYNSSHWCLSQFGHGIVQCATDLEHLYRIYSIPTHDKHQWLLLQFIVILMMDGKGRPKHVEHTCSC